MKQPTETSSIWVFSLTFIHSLLLATFCRSLITIVQLFIVFPFTFIVNDGIDWICLEPSLVKIDSRSNTIWYWWNNGSVNNSHLFSLKYYLYPAISFFKIDSDVEKLLTNFKIIQRCMNEYLYKSIMIYWITPKLVHLFSSIPRYLSFNPRRIAWKLRHVTFLILYIFVIKKKWWYMKFMLDWK